MVSIFCFAAWIISKRSATFLQIVLLAPGFHPKFLEMSGQKFQNPPADQSLLTFCFADQPGYLDYPGRSR